MKIRATLVTVNEECCAFGAAHSGKPLAYRQAAYIFLRELSSRKFNETLPVRRRLTAMCCAEGANSQASQPFQALKTP